MKILEYLAQIRTVKIMRTIQQTTGIVVWKVFEYSIVTL